MDGQLVAIIAAGVAGIIMLVLVWSDLKMAAAASLEADTAPEPCPFCGCTGYLFERSIVTDGHEEMEYSVVCANRSCITVSTDEWPTPDEATQQWNKRSRHLRAYLPPELAI